MKHLFPLLLAALLLISCKNEEEPGPLTFENLTFTTPVFIDGPKYNGVTFRNCIFENISGDGIQIRAVINATIENCIFRDISGNAIRFRNSGGSDGVRILNNEIYNIGENGILVPEMHRNMLIHGNHIYQVALDNTSSEFGAPHHGIYCQNPGVILSGNEIHHVINDNGNCISIRTSGLVDGNILYAATDYGISYFSDHPAGSDPLIIQNNIIYDNGRRGIQLVGNPSVENHPATATVRFNTVVADSLAPVAFKGLEGSALELHDNILVRTDGTASYLYTDLPVVLERNLTSAGDMGFVDFAGRDLHITPDSPAAGASEAALNFPQTDIDGHDRSSSGLDTGADEIF